MTDERGEKRTGKTCAFIQLGVEAHDDSFHYPRHKL